MKIEFNEWQIGCEISLTPETTKEVAELLRVAKNAKAVKPVVSFRFSGNEPYLSVFLEKIKTSVQSNSINNEK